MTIDELLDEVETMTADDILVFNEILNNRVREKKRKDLLETVFESRKEFRNGKAEISNPDEIVKEILL